MSQLWRVQGCNSADRLPSVNLQTTITIQVTSFWLIIISHPNSVFAGNAKCISPRVFFFTNLTHCCFAKLLEVVHSAGPYKLVRRFVLEVTYKPMFFCIHRSVYTFNLYTIHIYIYIANSNKHMYAHIIHIWFIIYTYLHAPPPVTVVNEGRVYQDPQVKTL